MSVFAGPPALLVGASVRSRQAVQQRIQQLMESLERKGLQLDVQVMDAEDYVLFSCLCVGQPGGADAWLPIVRCQVAAALADAAVGPLTQRWLSRRVIREARRRNLFLPPPMRPKVVSLARQLVEAPPAERPPEGGPAQTGAVMVDMGPVEPASAGGTTRPAVTGNLLRWQARIGRSLLEALGATAAGGDGGSGNEHASPAVLLEGVVRFRVREYLQALDRAAKAAVAELAAEREEQRLFAPWRSLWMGPPPRLYEVHVFKDDPASYRLLDRWGEPAAARAGGDGLTGLVNEEVLVSQLMRLGARRIVLHVGEGDPAQVAVRAAFPGRVHTCRGCHRCARARPGGAPRQPG